MKVGEISTIEEKKCYTKVMKLLVVPSIGRKEDNANYFLAQEIINMYHLHGAEMAVCAPEDCGIHRATIYPSPMLKTGFFSLGSKSSPKYYTEYLWQRKLTSASYLKEDTTAVRDAIIHFQPDLVFDLGRQSALIASKKQQVPVWSFVSGAMFRNKEVDSSYIKGINETLSEFRLEQILHLNELYAIPEKLFAFGPLVTNPFPESFTIHRLGSMGNFIEDSDDGTKVSIFLGDVKERSSKIKTIIEETFLGAPYRVEAYYEGCKVGHNQNIHYLDCFKEENLKGCSVVIHDGNEFIYNRSTILEKPQIIVSDGSYLRSWVASSASRNGFAISVNEKELGVQSIYEAYRRILVDDYYFDNAHEFSNQFKQLGDLTKLLEFH